MSHQLLDDPRETLVERSRRLRDTCGWTVLRARQLRREAEDLQVDLGLRIARCSLRAEERPGGSAREIGDVSPYEVWVLALAFGSRCDLVDVEARCIGLDVLPPQEEAIFAAALDELSR